MKCDNLISSKTQDLVLSFSKPLATKNMGPVKEGTLVPCRGDTPICLVRYCTTRLVTLNALFNPSVHIHLNGYLAEVMTGVILTQYASHVHNMYLKV